jgi:hypothetical protein
MDRKGTYHFYQHAKLFIGQNPLLVLPSQKTLGYCWRTYFSTYKAEISAGVLHASGPSEGSWVRRHFGASEFANSIPSFLGLIDENKPGMLTQIDECHKPTVLETYFDAWIGLQSLGDTK